MNTSKLLLGAVAGFAGYFINSGNLYTFIFKDILASANPRIAAVHVEPDMVALVLGYLSSGFLLAYIFEKWAGIRNPVSGALSGTMLSALVAFGYFSILHATTNLMSWTGIFFDTLINGICGAVAGAIIVFAPSYKRI